MKISVLMSVYYKERPEYLRQCFDSLVRQTLKAGEVVLVEDGPLSDSLLNVISDYRSTLNIITLKLPVNMGLANALNEGLRVCNYKIVARMDSDDICLPHRFLTQYNYLAARPELSAVSSYVEEFDDRDRTVSIRKLPEDFIQLVKFAKYRNPLSHPAVMFRLSDILAVGGYPIAYPEDHYLWIKLIQSDYKIGNVPVVLVKMRTGADFIKRRGFKFLRGELALLVYMFNTNFISLFELIQYSIGRSFVRLVPGSLKIFIYKYLRF